MATTFYLRADASDISGAGKQLLSLSRGSVSTTAITNTVAAGTNVNVTATAGGTQLFWFTPPLLGVTISGSVTVNGWGLESNLSANTTLGCEVDRVNNAGTFISTIKFSAGAAEWGTSTSALNVAGVPTSTTLVNGDRLQVTLFVSNFGTMATGFTATNSYGGPTAAADGDTFVTFTETLIPMVIPPPYVLGQSVKRAANF
jgi:hypothetical protein